MSEEAIEERFQEWLRTMVRPEDVEKWGVETLREIFNVMDEEEHNYN